MITSTDGLPFYLSATARQEFDGAPDWSKAGLAEFARRLPALSDAELGEVAETAIYHSARVNSWRGNWEHEHFKCSAVADESDRRRVVAGHDPDCHGPTIYSRAHARVMRRHRYQPSADGACRCFETTEEG